jgi:hypothetical protein
MLCRKQRGRCTKGKVVSIQNQEVEKSCIVLGGLDGRKFAKRVEALLVDLGTVGKLVSDLADNNDVGEKPMVSLGVEVDTDRVLIEHLDTCLSGAASRLIDLPAMARVARAALERSM